ncbi:MAG TPA: hypothetical protein VIM16_06030 [Mucilaginibacter sp.]|jgi:hypothetical protein
MINTQKINRFKKWKILNLIALPTLSKGEGVTKDTKITALLFKVLSFGEDLGEARMF